MWFWLEGCVCTLSYLCLRADLTLSCRPHEWLQRFLPRDTEMSKLTTLIRQSCWVLSHKTKALRCVVFTLCHTVPCAAVWYHRPSAKGHWRLCSSWHPQAVTPVSDRRKRSLIYFMFLRINLVLINPNQYNHPHMQVNNTVTVKRLKCFYQVFLLAYEEIQLYSSVSVDRHPLKQSVHQLHQYATLIAWGQDAHHLHWDI